MDTFLLTLVVTLFATLSHHLGLSEAVAEVVGRIASCPKCSTFWLVSGVLILTDHDVSLSLMSAILASYLSLWLGLVLYTLSNIYNAIWQLIRRKKRLKGNPRKPL